MMTVLYPGHRSSILECNDDCYSKVNDAAVSDTFDGSEPKGVLSGMVAGVAGSYVAGPGTQALIPAGLFLNNAAGNAFENSPGVAAGKVAIVRAMASVEVDIYETDGITYVIGDKLYCSDNSLLTNAASTNGVVIGVLTKLPTPTSPTLGLDMRI